MKKKNIRMIVDIAMTVLLPMLMAHSLIGEKFHEIAGTAIFVLFIAHHVFNRRWYGALFRGRYSSGRIFQTVIDTLLLIFMILQPISGILLSKYLYTFLPSLSISAQARSVHMLLAYWGYVLLGIHVGIHLTLPLTKLYRTNRKAAFGVFATLGAILVYGCFAFVKRGFIGYMFAKTAFAFFDYSEPILYFFLDYLSVMTLFMVIGWLLTVALNRILSRQKRKTE